jgi:hypothetical protein
MGKTLANNTSLMLTWISELNTQWTRVFSPGTIITVNETMFSWIGQCGDLRLTFLPRKPHPLSWMLKTSACAVLRVYTFLEFAQCKDNIMSGLEFVAEHKATHGCTLRLVKECFNIGRIIVADSWFGSVRIVTQLMKHGLYAVVAIRTGCNGFPKAELLATLQERISFAAFKKRVPVEVGGQDVDMLAFGWMDKNDMLVLTSCQIDAVALEALEGSAANFKAARLIASATRWCNACAMPFTWCGSTPSIY